MTVGVVAIGNSRRGTNEIRVQQPRQANVITYPVYESPEAPGLGHSDAVQRVPSGIRSFNTRPSLGTRDGFGMSINLQLLATIMLPLLARIRDMHMYVF
ncbi:hypothetical protein PoB_001930400 [Plakobranchus ocellatus]|uniref:Uncharacterized protein n=1 Tax=Plakobranchus ocellatus TaxID=259542 RepID=A0AAV3ZFX3_9GAST|nr:hypothetical protein PoB_001930400 [Plakobranchus ocellatus]